MTENNIILNKEEFEKFLKMIDGPLSDKQEEGLKRLQEAARGFNKEVEVKDED